MQRFFVHAVVSTLLVSLMLSGCYSARSLAGLTSRDVHTIEQARYDTLRATPDAQLSAVEVAERNYLRGRRSRALSVWEATAEGFDTQVLMRRDSIIVEQARYEALMSTPDLQLDQVEATTLRQQQMQREQALALVETRLQDRHINVLPTTALIFVGSFVALVALLAAVCSGGGCYDSCILSC